MTICNMSIEWGARAGMIAPDDTTFAYLEGREFAPEGRRLGARAGRLARARHRRGRDVRRAMSRSTSHELAPQVTWGTNPGMVVPVDRQRFPIPADFDDPDDRIAAEPRARVHGAAPGQAIEDIRIDRVFIGSCTNSRIEDLRAAAAVVAGRKVDPTA